MTTDTAVLKLGSSVLRNLDAFPRVADALERTCRRKRRVIAVVSAVGDTTDVLLKQAQDLANGRPLDPRALATLLSTGETASTALLTLELVARGITARPLDTHQLDLRGTGAADDAVPTSLSRERIEREFENAQVLVVPGFLVVGADGDLLLTGRGGSDLSALFIAGELAGEATLVKDVDGVYDSDPNVPGADARRYASLSWDDAAEVGGVIVQRKAVLAARAAGLSFRVAALGSDAGTMIGDYETRLDR
ncbi:MAG: hypothetical protein AAFU77_14470 [Myxococcota bacterium]